MKAAPILGILIRPMIVCSLFKRLRLNNFQVTLADSMSLSIVTSPHFVGYYNVVLHVQLQLCLPDQPTQSLPRRMILWIWTSFRASFHMNRQSLSFVGYVVTLNLNPGLQQLSDTAGAHVIQPLYYLLLIICDATPNI